MLVFGENDSHRLSNLLQTHIFWKFDHISGTYNQINYRNIWFGKVTIVLIMMAQVLFFDIFSEKDPHLNVAECRSLKDYYTHQDFGYDGNIRDTRYQW